MPRQSKSPFLKAISGSKLRGVQIPATEYPALVEIPPPPVWLPNMHAVAEWERLAPILIANRLLTEPGLAPFGLVCSLFGEIVATLSGGKKKSSIPSLVAQYRALANDFALTPVAQSRVKNLGQAAKSNPFDKFQKSAAGGAGGGRAAA